METKGLVETTSVEKSAKNCWRIRISAVRLISVMESVTANNIENSPSAPSEPNNNTPTPIADFVARPDFPHCVLNQLVDIGGYAGVVVDIVNNSLKVRSPEQSTKSFNFHTLKKLYGPRIESLPPPTTTAAAPSEPAKVEVKRNIITEPNFTAPVKPITEFVNRPDFPQCTFGEHVDVNGYVGVVVEIVSGSLKVRSQEEVTRSYNSVVLKKLHGGKQ